MSAVSRKTNNPQWKVRMGVGFFNCKIVIIFLPINYEGHLESS